MGRVIGTACLVVGVLLYASAMERSNVAVVLAAVTIDLGFRPRPWQERICRERRQYGCAVVHRRAGKSELVKQLLVDGALRARQPLATFAYIAPFRQQAKAIMLDRLKLAALKVPGTEVNESELRITFANQASVRLFGADNVDALRGLGLHGVALDEAADIDRRALGEVVMPMLADTQGWLLVVGTPRGPGNLLAEVYHRAVSDPAWRTWRFTVYDTGIFNSDQIAEMRRQYTPAAWAQEWEVDFNASSDDVLNPLEVVMAAVRREIDPAHIRSAPRLFGVDTAAMGSDASVVMFRQGLHAEIVSVTRGVPEKTLASRIATDIARYQPDAVFVEVNGYGGEVASRLRDLGHNVIDVNPGWKASDPERFVNLRAEMNFLVHQWLPDASIPDSAELIAQLAVPRFSYDTTRGRLQIESKDSIRQRLGSSTDYADALALTFSAPVAAHGVESVGRALSDWDPMQGLAATTGGHRS